MFVWLVFVRQDNGNGVECCRSFYVCRGMEFEFRPTAGDIVDTKKVYPGCNCCELQKHSCGMSRTFLSGNTGKSHTFRRCTRDTYLRFFDPASGGSREQILVGAKCARDQLCLTQRLFFDQVFG